MDAEFLDEAKAGPDPERVAPREEVEAAARAREALAGVEVKARVGAAEVTAPVIVGLAIEGEKTLIPLWQSHSIGVVPAALLKPFL